MRNIEVHCTIQDAWKQFEKQDGKCALSGAILSLPLSYKDKKFTNASLDRIDSSKPYDVDNIQWVDKHINIMKNALPENDFIEICRRIVENTKARVIRPWGHYVLLEDEGDYSIKMLFVAPGEETSLQRHSKRHELITLLDGTVKITHGTYSFTKGRSHRASSYRVLAGEWHRFAAPADQTGYTVLLEVAYGELDPDDFERKDDKYGRERKVGPGFVASPINNFDWRK